MISKASPIPGRRLLLVIALMALSARAQAGAKVELDVAGSVQHVEGTSEPSDTTSAGLGSATVEGEYTPAPATQAQPADPNQPKPWTSSVRGSLVGTAFFSTDRWRARLDGDLLTELGYAIVGLRVSYGRMPRFSDRYWRSGRELWLPGLALGGRGWRWRYGPSDLRIAHWLAEAETQIDTGATGPAWDARKSTNLGATLGLVSLERDREERELRLDAFVGSIRHYGTGRLLDVTIDVIRFQSRPRSTGWGGYAALGMSALRLTPGPLAVGPESPGQATPAAEVGVSLHGRLSFDLGLATFHRIDPSGAALDRGGRGQARIHATVRQDWSISARGDLVIARRVRVGDQLAEGASPFHDWLTFYRVQSEVRHAIGAGWAMAWRGWIEHSDRDDSLRFEARPIRARLSLATELVLTWSASAPPPMDRR